MVDQPERTAFLSLMKTTALGCRTESRHHCRRSEQPDCLRFVAVVVPRDPGGVGLVICKEQFACRTPKPQHDPINLGTLT